MAFDLGKAILGGGLLGGSIFDRYKNPADAAMPYLDKIPGQIKPYYDPYINAGGKALPNVQQMFEQLMSDPNSIISRIGAGYQKSPGYEFQLGQGEQAINNANAAGGMLGTPQHQQQAGQLASNLANQDFNQYLNNALGLFNTGLTGESGIANMGFGASTSLADAIAQILGSKAQLAYEGANADNEHRAGNYGGIVGGLSSLASAFGL